MRTGSERTGSSYADENFSTDEEMRSTLSTQHPQCLTCTSTFCQCNDSIFFDAMWWARDGFSEPSLWEYPNIYT